MDLATRIVQWTAKPPERWIRLATQYLPPGASAVLVLAIAYELAQLTWALAPGAPLDEPMPAVGVPAGGSTAAGGLAVDIDTVTSAHLFGEPPKEAPAPAQAVVDAPDTTLSLKLTGVQWYPDSTDGQAIIANGRNQERAYRVGDSIEGGSGSKLHAVYSDRVILNRAGRLETLRLPEEPAAGGVARPSGMPRVAPAPASNRTSLRDVISENASHIADIIHVVPALEGGQMIGFRVNPGRNREQFAALQFEPGDIVTDINGMTLDDPSRGLQVFQALGESTQANVTVIRDGQPQVLVIDTSQLQDLAQGRQ
jgi:general secretion pathway protein C